MKSVLRQQRRSSIAAAVVTLLLGLALVFWPNRSVGILCMLLGAAVLLTGILYILGWFSRHRDRVSALVLLPGVVFCGLGVWMLSSPGVPDPGGAVYFRARCCCFTGWWTCRPPGR